MNHTKSNVWLFSSFVLLSEDFKPDKRNSIIQTFMGSLTESSKKEILEQIQGWEGYSIRPY